VSAGRDHRVAFFLLLFLKKSDPAAGTDSRLVSTILQSPRATWQRPGSTVALALKGQTTNKSP
jgi:hypothetical protein